MQINKKIYDEINELDLDEGMKKLILDMLKISNFSAKKRYDEMLKEYLKKQGKESK